MTNLYLLLLHKHRLIHAIDLGVDADASRIIIDAVETIDGIGVHHLLVHRIPVFLDFLRVPTFCIAEAGCHVEILEQREGGTDRYFVLHTIAPILDIVFLEDLIVLSVDAGRESSAVSQGDFLIPPFVAHRMLALEGEDGRERDVQVGQSDRDGRVACGLSNVGRKRDIKFLVREIARIAHTGRLGVLRHCLGIVQVADIGLLITAGREVHAGREGGVGIGLGILTVRPHNLKVLSLGIVG